MHRIIHLTFTNSLVTVNRSHLREKEVVLCSSREVSFCQNMIVVVCLTNLRL